MTVFVDKIEPQKIGLGIGVFANSLHRILALYSHVRVSVCMCMSETWHPLKGKEKDRTKEEGITKPLQPV